MRVKAATNMGMAATSQTEKRGLDDTAAVYAACTADMATNTTTEGTMLQPQRLPGPFSTTRVQTRLDDRPNEC